MSELFTLFFNNLFPILLAAAIGFALAKWVGVNPRPLSQVVFYVFSPILVFNLIRNSQLSNQDILITLAFALVLFLCIGILTWLVGGALRLDRKTLAAVLITAMFMNAGNYGLPLTSFAFGEQALAFASIFFVVNAMLTNTVGIVIASSGSTSVINAIKGLIKFPAIYALSLGVIFLQFDWQLPTGLDRTVILLSNAAIPCMLVLVGDAASKYTLEWARPAFDTHQQHALIGRSSPCLWIDQAFWNNRSSSARRWCWKLVCRWQSSPRYWPLNLTPSQLS